MKVRTFVTEILEELELQEVESYKIVLAVDEVCANMMIHSNHCNPSRELDIQIELNPAENIVFVIKDRGIHFDLHAYKEPTMDEIITSKRKGGLGLMLVKRIMDRIEFTTDKNYNICRLTKNLKSS